MKFCEVCSKKPLSSPDYTWLLRDVSHDKTYYFCCWHELANFVSPNLNA